ncbi:MAG: helix-turn-helix domain-containing protein [Alphaproteobacteria bacterium]|jgi:hypothetical protein|nr:helix-turn-helix domain-containing protein [Alphaproteobacteria bacterium]
MQPPFLTPTALASRWKLAPKTLSQWRWNGHGPHYCKFGKLVRYPIEDVVAFEESKTFQTTGVPLIRLENSKE